MSVWLALPSKRPVEEVEATLRKWSEHGYKVALWCDSEAEGKSKEHLGRVIYPADAGYPGYAQAVNWLCNLILDDQSAEWIVAAGDDTLPDPNHSAEEIARDCCDYFAPCGRITNTWTFGVMQPTGDRWHEGVGGFTNAPIDRVAGSPWIGREFARRMYGGAGPYWHEYRHCFVDEELQLVAQKLGVFWQRRDLIHKHMHWARGSTDKEVVSAQRMPEFLAEANSPAHWRKYKAIFEARKVAGFPGHEPIV